MSVPISNIVDVNVHVSAITPPSSDFSLCLVYTPDTENETKKGQLLYYTYENYSTKLVSDGFLATGHTASMVREIFSGDIKPARVAVGVCNLTTMTFLEGLEYFRNKSDEFYYITVPQGSRWGNVSVPSVPDILELIDTFETPAIYCYQTSEISELESVKESGSMRGFGVYADDTDMLSPFVGLMAGLNTMKENSAYTLAYKKLNGAWAEQVEDEEDFDDMVSANGNTLVKFGSKYWFTYPGVVSNGYHVDEVYTIDLAKYLIQTYVINGITNTLKIPQTDSGVSMIVAMVANACNELKKIGLIDSGVWNGGTVGDLENGDAIQDGYYIYAGSVADMSAADKAARKSPAIKVALHASGAIEHVIIDVFIDR